MTAQHTKFSQVPSSPTIDKVGVEERVARFQSRSIKGPSKMQGLSMVLSMIDLTTLEGKDTPNKVRQMCYKAQHLHDVHEGLPTVAAVFVAVTVVFLVKNWVNNLFSLPKASLTIINVSKTLSKAVILPVASSIS